MAKEELPVIQTAGLTKVFKDFWRRDRVVAVKDLNLDIRRGEVFGLLGPNGSGKSTTIKMILGLLYPSKGRISVFGRAPTDVGVKSRIGFLPEESYLYRFLDAGETLDYYARLFRQPEVVRDERIQRLLEMVGLTHEAKRRVGEYSKGMARRIGLAQALINDPELLILDEPTAGLDPIGTRQIKDVIRDLGKRGKTILLSSHLLADVEDVCDRVMILYGGQVRAQGTTNELLSKKDLTQITADRLSSETLSKVRAVIEEEEGKHVLDVSSPADKLESYFLRIVAEAQVARVKTFGAQAAGAVPDFLTSGASGGKELVDSLVSAARGPKAVGGSEDQEPVPAPAAVREKPSKKVIEQLTTSKGKPAEQEGARDGGPGAEEAVPRPAGEKAAAGASEGGHPPSRRDPVRADRKVIDSLIQKGRQSAGHGEDKKEDNQGSGGEASSESQHEASAQDGGSGGDSGLSSESKASDDAGGDESGSGEGSDERTGGSGLKDSDGG